MSKPFQKLMFILGIALLTSSCDFSSLVSLSDDDSQSSSISHASVLSETSYLEVAPVESSFDFDVLNEIQFSFDADIFGDISHIEGLNIANGDYVITENLITINPNFLVTLDPGQYTLTLYATNGNARLPIQVIDRHNQYRIINESLETGNLVGWTSKTIFKGENNLQSFTDAGIVINGPINSATKTYDGSGDFLYGIPSSESLATWEEKMGTITSSSFTLGGDGYISFKLGAGKNIDLAHLSIRRVSDDHELYRFGNQMFDISSGEEQYFGENLVTYFADISNHLGAELYVELVDIGGRDWDFITFDDIKAFHEEIPQGIAAINQLPPIGIDYAPNQIANGYFVSNLDYWTPSMQTGWQKNDGTNNTFIASDGVLRTNATGDSARGLLRSTPFRVDGSGFMSLELGAGQGSRNDKDTFVSIKTVLTNREIIRFANVRHNGNELIRYYVDLREYMQAHLYIEIIDNGMGSWDTLFVDNIITFYSEQPNITFADLAVNLNY